MPKVTEPGGAGAGIKSLAARGGQMGTGVCTCAGLHSGHCLLSLWQTHYRCATSLPHCPGAAGASAPTCRSPPCWELSWEKNSEGSGMRHFRTFFSLNQGEEEGEDGKGTQCPCQQPTA